MSSWCVGLVHYRRQSDTSGSLAKKIGMWGSLGRVGGGENMVQISKDAGEGARGKHCPNRDHCCSSPKQVMYMTTDKQRENELQT